MELTAPALPVDSPPAPSWPGQSLPNVPRRELWPPRDDPPHRTRARTCPEALRPPPTNLPEMNQSPCNRRLESWAKPPARDHPPEAIAAHHRPRQTAPQSLQAL